MSLLEKLRKPNWLNELRGVVIAGMVLTAGFGLYEVYHVTFGGGAAVASMHGNPVGPDEFEVGGQRMQELETQLAILEPTGKQVAWYLATQLPTMLVVIAVLGMLLRLLTRARQANPFTRATVRDLRWIGWTLIIGGATASLIEGFATMGLSENIPPGSISGTWDLPILWLFFGFGALAVSEIVARGCALREELDEVV